MAEHGASVPPPLAPRAPVVDVLHGVEVADPYRWLEPGDTPEVRQWVAEQNDRTRRALDRRPDRRYWHDRVTGLLEAPLSVGVRAAGGQVLALERAGGAPQYRLVLRAADRLGEPGRVLVDPAALTGDPTTAIDWYHPSRDGRLVALGLSAGGDERSTLRVLDVASGRFLSDEIPETRAASVSWLPDASGFLYTRYPPDDEYHRMVYRHDLGRPWSDDPLVWGDLPTPETWPDVRLSPDGRWILVTAMVGWSRTDLHLAEAGTGRFVPLVEGVEATSDLRFDGERLVGVTTLDAPRGRVVAVPVDGPGGPWTSERWQTLVPEGETVLEVVRLVGDEMLVAGTRHGVASLARVDRSGRPVDEVVFPEPSSITGFDAEPDGDAAYLQLEGFTRPSTLYRWTPGTGLVSASEQHGVLDLPEFTVSQERYRSGDGTDVGLFVIHRADVTPSADSPTVLTGYGGFALAMTPGWSPLAAAWCEAGGVVAVAQLRGGNEEGEAWHHAGRREQKQHVFDDFAAAADHLVATRRTSRDRLAIRGGSNGGLLVGAALTQRPDLCRAVHCAVPLLDMVRYSRFLIARLWTDEYGDPEVPEEFAWLWAYSPYHRVEEGRCYPAVLLTTAEGDSRVDPSHARKMAAALQWATACPHERPILLYQEDRAGHGVGKPLHKQGDELADVLSFLTWQLGAPEVAG